jgi:hypothetical protein
LPPMPPPFHLSHAIKPIVFHYGQQVTEFLERPTSCMQEPGHL